jgi:phage terminase large subunit-like protein
VVAEESSDGLHIAGWCNEVAAAAPAAAAAAAPQQGQQEEEEVEVVAASAALELTVLVVNTGTGQKTHRSLLRCHYILRMHHFAKTGSGHT